MKHFLSLFILLLVQQAGAQYFFRYKGDQTTFESNAQFAPRTFSANSYMMAGMHVPSASPVQLHIVRTSVNGNSTGSNFNKSFRLSDAATGTIFGVYATSIVEITSNGDFAVAGIATDPANGQEDFFVLRINFAGLITWAYRYAFPDFNFRNAKINMDLNNANILVTGTCQDVINTFKLTDVYAFSINAGNGAINWAKSYDLPPSVDPSLGDHGHDIIHNPYTPSQAIIVGASSGEGLFMPVDISTGAPLGAPLRYMFSGGVPAPTQSLHCINRSNNTTFSVTPFIVGGEVVRNGQTDAWTMLIDEHGTILWSTLHDNSFSPGLNNTLNEVMERQNTGGQYEYYTVGTIYTATNSNIHVLKLGSTGKLVNQGEFSYGLSTQNETGQDIHRSVDDAGFVASGSSTLLAGQQVLLKAYYNGRICSTLGDTNTFVSDSILPTSLETGVDTVSDAFSYSLDTVSFIRAQSSQCNSSTVSGGSNALVRPFLPLPGENGDEAGPLDFAVYSNTGQGPSIYIKMENDAPEGINARLFDLTGRELPCHITSGDNRDIYVSCDVPCGGMYCIVLSDGVQSRAKIVYISR